MKVLYGVQTTGNGHINRSSRLISELRKKGAKVDILTSGGFNDIKLPFIVDYKLKGFELKYKGNKVSFIKTLLSIKPLKIIKEIKYIKGDYDLVISDFEPMSALWATLNKVKSISVSNQKSFNNKNINLKGGFLSKLFIKYFAYCKNNIGLSYKNIDDNVFLPIISRGIVESDSCCKNFYIVYLPHFSNNEIIDVLTKSNYKFKVFTTNKPPYKVKNIKFYKISKITFQKHLINSSGVITSSGFGTTSEALYLNKKLWSIPIKSQWEQESNALILREMGVYTGEFNSENLNKWISEYKPIKWRWEDPTKKIIKKIFKIYGKH